MFQLIKDFFSENGRGSSKRWVAISTGLVLLWAIWFAVKAATTDVARQNIINSVMVFVGIVLGVATVAQIASIIRGGNTKDEPKDTPPNHTP